jgi:hypothetical protein
VRVKDFALVSGIGNFKKEKLIKDNLCSVLHI